LPPRGCRSGVPTATPGGWPLLFMPKSSKNRGRNTPHARKGITT
jgi:hypothetical protein